MKAIVLAVGAETLESKTGLFVDIEKETAELTQLQKKLIRIAEGIGQLGIYIASLTFMVTVVFTILRTYQQIDRSFDIEFLQDVCKGIAQALTIVFVATPEGLSLAVTISMAYSVGKMYKKKNLVMKLHSFETMSHLTEICTDMRNALTIDNNLRPGVRQAIDACK